MSTKDTPYIAEDGTLVIPGECVDNTCKWWKSEGRPIEELLRTLDVTPEVWARYSDKPFPEEQPES
ncbi:MAG: hypothetical protein ACNI3A_12345 [Desulfovibrio sp.]|uniref:hypothetical protein n=1 Tax=Desulfovibrio sp. 7SRBS1 TaxID=3378064 RepID=UPI003B4060EE